jgi:hypothetical protein
MVTTTKRVEEVKREAKAPDETKHQHKADFEAATQPGSGAPVSQAAAGAGLASQERASESGETADALKRAAENDTRT